MPAFYGRRSRHLSRGISLLIVGCVSFAVAFSPHTAAAFEPADSSLPARGNNWVLLLNVVESLDAGADSIGAPWLGMTPTATDDFDRFVDFVAPPPTPIAGRPSAYLENTALEGDFQTLIADMRAFPLNPFTSVTWTLVVDNVADTDWFVSWQAAGIPRLWASATITDGVTDYDMRAISAVTVPADSVGIFEITLSRAAVGPPTAPPGAGLFGLLVAGQMVAANVPDSIYNGLSLSLSSDPIDFNPTDGIVLPVGFSAVETNLMRDVRIERDGVSVTEFDEPIEIEITFDDGDLPDGVTVDQLIPFRIDANGEIEILRVVARGESSVTFETYRLSTVGLGASDGNEAPTVREAIADQTISILPGVVEVELVETVTTSVFFDDETPVDDLTYAASVSDATIVSDPVVSGTLVTVATTGAASGSTVVTVTATDGGGLSTSTTFTVTVTSPILEAIDAQSTDEDTALTVAIAVDYEGDLVIEAYESDNGSAILGSVVADGLSVTITPAADANGSTEVVVVAYDAADSSISTSTTFGVTVVAVNDPPLLDTPADVTIDEDDQATDISLSAGDPGGGDDESTQTLTYTATSSDTAILADPGVRDYLNQRSVL